MNVRLSPRLLVGFGIAVLAAFYLALAISEGRFRLWGAIVHEGGHRTLGETILYPSHLLREVPVALVYGLFAAAAVPLPDSTVRRARRAAPWALAAAVALVAGAFVLEARAAGAGSAWRDLLQHRIRDDLYAPGAHWRYHWLSTVWFGAVAPYYARAVRSGGPPGATSRLGWIAWIGFGVLTLVFGVSLDVLLHPRFVGHQAREILQVATVTLPLTIGILALGSGSLDSRTSPPLPSRPWRKGLRIGLSIGIPVYLALATLGLEAMRFAQPGASPARLVAAHAFEHGLDVVLCVLIALAARGFAAARRTDQKEPPNGRIRPGKA